MWFCDPPEHITRSKQRRKSSELAPTRHTHCKVPVTGCAQHLNVTMPLQRKPHCCSTDETDIHGQSSRGRLEITEHLEISERELATAHYAPPSIAPKQHLVRR